MHYFNANYGDDLELDNLNHDKPIDWYINFFRDAKPSQIKGGITPQYFSDPATPYSIRNFNPAIKLIAVIREPVERTISALKYRQFRRGKHDYSNFPNMVNQDATLLDSSKYYYHLSRFYKLFPNHNIKVLLYDDLKKDNKKFLSDIYNFLGVREFYPENIDSYSNVTGQVRFKFINRLIRDSRRLIRKYHLVFLTNFFMTSGLNRLAMKLVNSNIMPIEPNVTSENDKILVAELKQYFLEDICKLEVLINQDLSAWK